MADINPPNTGDQQNQAPQVVNQEDVVATVRVVLTKKGQVLVNYPQDNLPLALELMSAGIRIVAGLIKKQADEPRRVLPVTNLPPGILPRTSG